MEVAIIGELPKTKEEAIQLKSKSYFTGVICKNGHLDKRYTSTGICYSCKQMQANRDYENHKERVVATNTISRKKNQGAVNFRSRKWSERNIELSREIKKRSKVKCKEQNVEKNRIYNAERRKCVFFAQNKRVHKAVWSYLKGFTVKSKYDGYLGYSFATLKEHLEILFIDKMNWGNYGTYWEIDHKIPTSWFETHTYETIKEFIIDVWKISNVHPITVFENASKSNRYAHI